jgi:cytochrome P450/NADPH-cytochrome P450 reductase
MVLRGGTRIIPLGTCDVAEKGVVDQFDAWKDTLLWPALSPSANSKPVKGEVQPDIEMEISTDKRASALRQDVDLAVIRDTKILTSPDQPEKRHLEFQLPSEMSYRVGDYIGILPLNPAATVRRVLKRFCLPWDATIKIGSRNTTMLPTSAWISAHDMLQGYVELSQPASMKASSLSNRH